MKSRRVVAEENLAVALNRPIKKCLNCGQVGVEHWWPDHIEEDRFIPGGYECDRRGER